MLDLALERREQPAVPDVFEAQEAVQAEHQVGAAFVALLDSTVQGPVNIGSGRGVAVRELVELIGATVGRPELIEYGAVPMASNDPPSLVADVGRLRDEVRFEPRFDLPAGIRDSVAWWERR